MDAEVEALAAFIHTSEVPMTLADPQLPDCPVVSSNAAFQSLTGYAHNVINGKNCRFLQGDVTDQPDLVKLRKDVRNSRSCIASLLNFKASGESFHNLLIIEPLILQCGRVLFIGCQFDFEISVEDDQVARAVSSRYAEIDRMQNHIKHQLNGDIRVALKLRASAAISSVKNYKTRRQVFPW